MRRKAKRSKKKDIGIAFIASKHIESSSENNDDEEVNIEEMKYLTKKFHKLFNKNRIAKNESKRRTRLFAMSVMNRVMSNQISYI